MDKKNELRNFLENDYTADYLKKNDEMIRRIAMSIDSTCKNLTEIIKAGEKKNGTALLNNLVSDSCRLLRVNQLSAVLAEKDSPLNKTIIYVDDFVRDFADGCRVALGGKCSFKMSNLSETCVNSEKNLLGFFMLGYVRRAVLAADGKKLRFIVGSEKDGDKVNIYIRISEFIDLTEIPDRSFVDFFDGCFEEVNEIFSEKLDADFRCGNAELVITLPVIRDDGGIVIRSSEITMPDETFSVYNIMLGGLM